MASVALDVIERRHECRVAGGGPRFGAGAVLRPGQAVILVNTCSRGALVESGARLRPGVQTELHLSGKTTRTRVKGRVERCQVVRLDPVRFQGVIVFDECVEIGAGAEGSE